MSASPSSASASASSSRTALPAPIQEPAGSRRASSSSSNLLLRPTSSSRPTYHSHPGCTLCSIVSSAASHDEQGPSPRTTSTFLPHPLDTEPSPQTGLPTYSSPFERERDVPASQERTPTQPGGREVLYKDEDITVVRATGKERLVDGGRHLLVIINKHLESVYDLGPSDVPLLSRILELARHILTSIPPAPGSDSERGRSFNDSDLRVGFVGPISKDPQSPYAHLHAHATLGPYDAKLPGATFWRRNVVLGPMNWWSVEDLRAEIRESTSNNRVKSGYEHRGRAPIDRVPDAGSITGLPNALDPDPYTDLPTPPPASSQFLPHISVPMDRRAGTGSGSSGGTVRDPIALGKGKQREEDVEYQDVDLGVVRSGG
ncbi:hypothetical protein BCR39DRAFT_518376 [Naematelia encephala]|uniref:HIT domain-containing protein n=1 Tax=Naematelia encephala TaxID=71784 RepID=A0A1Y2BGZ5_9TREE|nr:hypothetical protein BCR39DRAFT_518376 [Naematelia encephala]